mgnify:CR=1 FL=1
MKKLYKNFSKKLFFCASLVIFSSSAQSEPMLHEELIPLRLEITRPPFLTQYLLAPMFSGPPIKSDQDFKKGVATARKTFESLNQGQIGPARMQAAQAQLAGLLISLDIARHKYPNLQSTYLEVLDIFKDISFKNGVDYDDPKQSYLGIVASYLGDASSDDDIKALLKIRANPGLTPAIQRRIKLIESYAKSASRFEHKSGLAGLNRLNARPQFVSPLDRLVEKMTLAHAAAGLDSRGDSIAKPSGRTVQLLKQVVTRSTRIDKNLRSKVLEFAAGVWKAAYDKPWSVFPILLKPQLTLTDCAIRERVKKMQGVNKNDLINFYLRTTKNFNTHPSIIEISRSIFQIAKKEYKQNQQVTRFYSIQEELRRNLSKKSKFRDYLDMNRLKFVTHVIKKALTKGASKSFVAEVTKIGERERALNLSLAGSKDFSLAVAALLEKKGSHKSAEKMLENINQKQSSMKSITKLIRIQQKIALWPTNPPFANIPKSNLLQNRKLLNSYQRLKKIYRSKSEEVPWSVVAHIGLLQMSLGKNKEANQLWMRTFSRSPKNPRIQSLALGSLIVKLKKKQDHKILLKVLEKARALKIPALHLKQRLNIDKYLKDTLFTLIGSPDSIGANRIKYSQKFLKIAVKDRRIGEVSWQLAKVLENKKSPLEALQVIKRFLEKKQANTTDRRRFLLKGHEIAYQQKKHASSVAFGLSYIEEFSKSRDTPRVRKHILEVLQKKGVKSRYVKLGFEHFRDKRSRRRDKMAVAFQILKVPTKYASAKIKSELAAFLLKNARSSRERAVAIGHYAHIAYKNRNSKELRNLAKNLGTVRNKNKERAATAGQIAFYLANLQLPRSLRVSSKKPDKEIVRLTRMHTKIQAGYEVVCNISNNPYCSLAQLQLAKFSEKIASKIDALEVTESMTSKQADAFDKFRLRAITSLKARTKLSLGIAARLANEKDVLPGYSKQIMRAQANFNESGFIGN